MLQTEYKIKDYLEILGSEAPAPGGGAVSALTAAQGIALVMMVANLTIGKEKYKKFEKVNQECLKVAEGYLERLIELMEEDAKAFNLVTTAYKMPKETEEEKKERSKAIKEATMFATIVPVEVMEASYEGLRLTTTLMGKSNPNVVSDLGAAAVKLDAAIKSSWLNVKINLPSLKEPEKEKDFMKKGEEIYKDGEDIAKKIYDQVIEILEN